MRLRHGYGSDHNTARLKDSVCPPLSVLTDYNQQQRGPACPSRLSSERKTRRIRPSKLNDTSQRRAIDDRIEQGIAVAQLLLVTP